MSDPLRDNPAQVRLVEVRVRAGQFPLTVYGVTLAPGTLRRFVPDPNAPGKFLPLKEE